MKNRIVAAIAIAALVALACFMPNTVKGDVSGRLSWWGTTNFFALGTTNNNDTAMLPGVVTSGDRTVLIVSNTNTAGAVGSFIGVRLSNVFGTGDVAHVVVPGQTTITIPLYGYNGAITFRCVNTNLNAGIPVSVFHGGN